MSIIKAAIIIIASEVLSGKIQNKNDDLLLKYLKDHNIKVEIIIIIPDNRTIIKDYVSKFSKEYNYVFTTGGVGSTHDDITVEAVSEGLDLTCKYNEKSLEKIELHCQKNNKDFNTPRKKFAFMPEDAIPIYANLNSPYPLGYIIKNVIIFPGPSNLINKIMHNVLFYLNKGDELYSDSVKINSKEPDIAEKLKIIQEEHPTVEIGVYPHHNYTKVTFDSYYKNELIKVMGEVELI